MSNTTDTSSAELIAQLTAQLGDLRSALNCAWMISNAVLVFIMQLGMALLQVGGVRATNCKNVTMQTIITTCIAILMWWMIGYGIFEGRFSDGIGSLSHSATDSSDQFALFFFFWGFDAASSAIISCAVTSRVLFTAYIVACTVYSGFVFPIAAYWVWGKGMFTHASGNNWVVIDFAGGLPVHTVGGLFAVVGAYIIGPRHARFSQNKEGKWEDNRESGHSVLFQTIGAMLLWFGWFGFNGGSGLVVTDGFYVVAARAAMNTLVAPSIAGLVITVYMIQTRDVHDLVELLNGVLCGLVAITPACATVPTWAAIIIGATSVFPFILGTRLLSRLRIDDVLDAFPMHGMCGIWGTICTALFSQQTLIDQVYGPGVIDFSIGRQLSLQLFGTVVCGSFAIASSAILFTILKHTAGLRVSEGDERVGLDFKYHAGYAYPDFNQRVKRAHEQIQMEAELAAQVRRQVMQGKESRLKEAAHSAPTENLKHVPSTTGRHSIDRGSKAGSKGSKGSQKKDGGAGAATEAATGEDNDANGDSSDAEEGVPPQVAGLYAGFLRLQQQPRRPSLTSSSASSMMEPSFNSVHYRKAFAAPTGPATQQDSTGKLRPVQAVGSSAAASDPAATATAAAAGGSGTNNKRPMGVESGQFHRRMASEATNGGGGASAASASTSTSATASNGGANAAHLVVNATARTGSEAALSPLLEVSRSSTTASPAPIKPQHPSMLAPTSAASVTVALSESSPSTAMGGSSAASCDPHSAHAAMSSDSTPLRSGPARMHSLSRERWNNEAASSLTQSAFFTSSSTPQSGVNATATVNGGGGSSGGSSTAMSTNALAAVAARPSPPSGASGQGHEKTFALRWSMSMQGSQQQSGRMEPSLHSQGRGSTVGANAAAAAAAEFATIGVPSSNDDIPAASTDSATPSRAVQAAAGGGGAMGAASHIAHSRSSTSRALPRGHSVDASASTSTSAGNKAIDPLVSSPGVTHANIASLPSIPSSQIETGSTSEPPIPLIHRPHNTSTR